MKKRHLSMILSACLMAVMIPQTAAAQATGDQQKMACIQPGTLMEQGWSADDRTETGTMSNQELFAGYVDQLFRGKTGKTSADEPDQAVLFAEEGREALTGLDLVVYEYLRVEIEKIAAGERASSVITVPNAVIARGAFGVENPKITAEDLGVETLVENGNLTQEAVNAFMGRVDPDFKRIKEYLLNDLPYEMYWYDKTVGTTARTTGISGDYDQDGTLYLTPYGDAVYSFAVAPDYQDTTDENPDTHLYRVDAERVQRAQTAAANARAIVEKYQKLSDSEKIRAYQEAICELASYDEEGLAKGPEAGMDPWQLINVFDGDPATNVVCEGYAKAFQYLFEMSTFQSRNLKSILVTGSMKSADGNESGSEDGEPDVREADGDSHMWSVVTMEDGQNYLVDVTNSDEDSVGGPEAEGKPAHLVLRGMAGNVQDGYSLTIEKEGYYPKTVSYEYDEKTRNLFGEKRLTLSDTDYHPGDTIWQNEFEYTLDEDTLTITLTKYLGTDQEVTVPLNAVIGGKTYQSSWEDSIFETSALVKVEKDLSASLDEKNQNDLKVTLTYAPKEDEGEVILHLSGTDPETGSSQQTLQENFQAILASYDENGRMTGVQFLEPAETDQGIEFTGSRSGQQDQLMLIDRSSGPVMDSFVM